MTKEELDLYIKKAINKHRGGAIRQAVSREIKQLRDNGEL